MRRVTALMMISRSTEGYKYSYFSKRRGVISQASNQFSSNIKSCCKHFLRLVKAKPSDCVCGTISQTPIVHPRCFNHAKHRPSHNHHRYLQRHHDVPRHSPHQDHLAPHRSGDRLLLLHALRPHHVLLASPRAALYRLLWPQRHCLARRRYNWIHHARFLSVHVDRHHSGGLVAPRKCKSMTFVLEHT